MDMNYDLTTKIFSQQEQNPFTSTKGIGYELYESMKKHGDVIAQIDSLTGQKFTYNDYLQRSIRTALQMKTLGIKAGDVIAIPSSNHIHSIVPYIAAQLIGAVAANIDPNMTSKDMENLLLMTTPKIAFASENAVDNLEAALNAIGSDCNIVTFGHSDRFVMFDKFLLPQPDEDTFQPYVSPDGTETAIIMFSSGTSGSSKGVCLSHNFVGFIMPHFQGYIEENIQTYLICSSMCWISCVLYCTFILTSGRTHVISSEFSPEATMDLIIRYKIDLVFVSTATAIRLYRLLTPNVNLPLKYMIFGGQPMPSSTLSGIRGILPNTHVLEVYGMTEAGWVLSFSKNDAMYKSKLKSCGSPMIGIQYKVVNPETEQAATFNESGELRIKSPHFMNGYYKGDSSDAYDADGFFKTGDMAYYDEDFCIYIVDRLKDTFKFNGWQVIPTKIEAILESHPAVQRAAVIGISDPVEGSHAMGVVVLNNTSKVTTKELELYVDSQVDDRDRLRAGIEIVQYMPLTHSGKIKRRVLTDTFENKRNVVVR